jgi:hypothetical protein
VASSRVSARGLVDLFEVMSELRLLSAVCREVAGPQRCLRRRFVALCLGDQASQL